MVKDAGKIVVEVEPRSDSGKNACRRLRARERIPANVYGLGLPPFMVAVGSRALDDLLRLESGMNTIFSLSLSGDGSQQRETMIKELQRDPVTDKPIHVDFVRIDASKPVQVSVPIHLVGLATGVKNEGGILDFVHRDLLVECLPGNIPGHLDVDVSELHINQHVSIKDLAVGENVRVLGDPEQIVAVVVAPRVEETPVTEEVEAAAEGAEPEVAPKGKEAEEAESGGKADK